ncbi:MAG: fatty-acyl-CoA synthase [Nocardioidaceae bacterium]|nr:fatty-acyl-CoA synthase [Nocardioidaceae bacterium]
MTNLSQVGALQWPAGVSPPAAGTLPALVDAQASTDPDRIAVTAEGLHVTYRELADRSLAAAGALRAQGIGRGGSVALLAPNSAEWLAIAVGAIRIGATLHAFNTWVRPAELDYLLRASGAELLVIVDVFASTDFIATVDDLTAGPTRRPGAVHSARYPALRKVLVLGEAADASWVGHWHVALAASVPPSEADVSEPQTAPVIIYTSGSTRAPKAVPMVQRMMIDNGFAIGERMGLTEDDSVWLASPLFWSYGIANAAMATFTHGARLVLEDRFEPRRAVQTLAVERCTAAYLLPTIADALCQECPEEMRALDHLRTGLTIGRPDEIGRIVTELGVEGICNIYGSTEVYGNCCVTDWREPLDVRLHCQGLPLPGVEVRIVDEKGGPVERGMPGQIEVRGRVMPGYLPGPDGIVESPMTTDGWFRTGDTGLLRPDDRLQFVGRHSEMIKSAGIKVSPAEIEERLRDYPGVLEAAVVGRPDDTRGEVPVAFLVMESEPDEAAIVAFCREALSSYKVPKRIIRIDALPQTATGKLSRKALLELDLNGAR